MQTHPYWQRVHHPLVQLIVSDLAATCTAHSAQVLSKQIYNTQCDGMMQVLPLDPYRSHTCHSYMMYFEGGKLKISTYLTTNNFAREGG